MKASPIFALAALGLTPTRTFKSAGRVIFGGLKNDDRQEKVYTTVSFVKPCDDHE